MTDLADADLLRVWETMRGRSLPRRAAALLALAAPGSSADTLAALGLDEVQRRLLGLVAGTIGPRLACLADCPACGETIEFDLDVAMLAERLAEDEPIQPRSIEPPGYALMLTPPSLGDCIVAADAPDLAAAERALLERCLRATDADGLPLPASALPSDVREAAEAVLDAFEGASRLDLALPCPACGSAAELPFDIAAHGWSEIESRASRLLAQVHRIASRYGWCEADIVAMHPARRDRYLAWVDG